MLKKCCLVMVMVAVIAVSDWDSVAHGQNPAPQANTGRWQIYRADLAPGSEMQGRSGAGASNSTILLDSVTGDTWLLWPTDVGGKRFYAWVPLDKQKSGSPNTQPPLGR